MPDYASLVNNLGSDDPNRSEAWDSLKQAESAAVPALIQGLQEHPDETARIDCVRLLDKLTDPRIDPALLHAMRQDPSWQVRGHCVKSIGNIEDDDVIEVAVDLLLDGIVPAADRLRRDPQSYKASALLHQRLEMAATPEARAPLFDALMRLSSPQTYEQYIDWLDHAEPDFRFQAAMALERHAYTTTPNLKQEAYRRLLDRVKHEADGNVQARMVEALGSFWRLFDKQAFDLLTEYLDHQNENIAKTAHRALKAAGYDPGNKNLQCALCGKSQPESKVEKCKICGKPVCQEHWVRDPMAYHFFCSKPHEEEFTKAQGADYWK